MSGAGRGRWSRIVRGWMDGRGPASINISEGFQIHTYLQSLEFLLNISFRKFQRVRYGKSTCLTPIVQICQKFCPFFVKAFKDPPDLG